MKANKGLAKIISDPGHRWACLVISDFITEFLEEQLNLQNVHSLPCAEHSKPAAVNAEVTRAGE